VPGLGPKRRAALIDRFESMGNLRSASVEDVAQVPTINKALAEKVVQAVH
jgi:excinuclease ABC subunit C